MAVVESICRPINLPGERTVQVDIVFCGMWYCMVELSPSKNPELCAQVQLECKDGHKLVSLAGQIRAACVEQHPVCHPITGYQGPDMLLFYSRNPSPDADAMNAVVNEWKATLLRSACGTATCAAMALAYAQGELSIQHRWLQKSIVGSMLAGRLTRESKLAGTDKTSVIAEYEGRAWISQKCEIVIDPTDPFQSGFMVSDLWGECRGT